MATKRRDSLLREASEAGYTVENRDGDTYVYKLDRKQRKQGIVIFEDGTALLLDTRPDVCKGMRSYKDMRSVLKLKPEAL